MAKKILAIVLALGMLGYMAAPAMAANRILILNINWVGSNSSAVVAESWSGGSDIDDTEGDVDVTNDDADADAAGVVATNSNVSDVGEAGADSDRVAVVNFNGAGTSSTAVMGGAYTGGDYVTDTEGDVTVDNGTSTSSAQGFLVTNTNITRVR